jgi:Spy/CpxP family protein refolding chaperone
MSNKTFLQSRLWKGACLSFAAITLSQAPLLAQSGPEAGDGPVVIAHQGHAIKVRRIGKWWENPDLVSKLQLTESQTTQLNQIFYDHRMKLIDYGADMEKQDLKLQTLLDADQPNESQVSSQVDQVLAARGKIEREYTMMNLAQRKVLTVDQWKQLKTLRGDSGMPGGNLMYFHRQLGPGGPGEPPMPPPPPPDMQ